MMETCNPEDWYCFTTGNMVLDCSLALIIYLLWTYHPKDAKR